MSTTLSFVSRSSVQQPLTNPGSLARTGNDHLLKPGTLLSFSRRVHSEVGQDRL